MDRLRENLGPITPRQYEVDIASQCLKENTLIVLPTGLGKTAIAALVAREIMDHGKRVLFLAPTKPLVSQHLKTLKSFLNLDRDYAGSLTGETSEKSRPVMMSRKLLVSTPQSIENEIAKGSFVHSGFGLVVFDEVHRATGNYSYVAIARNPELRSGCLFMGMTASPGSDRSRLMGLMNEMGFSKIIVKTEKDPEISRYVNDTRIEVVRIKRPREAEVILTSAWEVLRSLKERLSRSEYFAGATVKRSDVARAIPDMVQRARSGETELFGLVSQATAFIRFDYAVEYLESQGVEIFHDYISRILSSQDRSAIRTIQILRSHPEFHKMMSLTETFLEHGDNPKMLYVQRLITERLKSAPESRIIVFTHFRKTSDILSAFLAKGSGDVKVARFIGQGSKAQDKGLKQKEQEEILQKFRNGDFNVLVATSVAEEGLDIPATDLVIFFEPISSDIRSIQRRGRTGRARAGEVIILTYEGGRDIGYLLSSFSKERKMISNIRSMGQESASPQRGKKKDLFDFS